ncbi:hypothetical protein HN51_046506 [Arachis hypogaea]
MSISDLHYIDWNVNQLEASLEFTFKKAYAYQLQGASMMANVIYILKKATKFEFELSEEDGWVKKQASILQSCFEQYNRQNHIELLNFFKQHNVKAMGSSMWNMLRGLELNSLDNHSAEFLKSALAPNSEELLERFHAFLNGNQDTHHLIIICQSF